MPTLGNALDFSKYEARNLRQHQLGTAPSSPVTGQEYYNTADNTLYFWDGSQWVSERGGASSTPPATTTSLGTVQLAGDLTGTATSPQIATGVIVDADVAAANKDGAVATPSLRTIGTGAQQAMAGNTRLDTIAAPTGPVSLNSQRITSLADPSGAQDAATKNYVDLTAQGLDAKASVRAIATTNITLSGTQTIDGVALVANDRCLVAGQTTQSANGIYSVQSGAWTRTTDADAWTDLVSAFVFVESGTANADSGWVCTVDPGGTLGTTNVTWTQFSGAGQITAGAGLTKTGNSLDVGAGAGITVNADNIQITAGGVTQAMLAFQAAGYYSTATHGAGATITITQATHGLRASRGLIVQAQIDATGAVVLPDITVAANGDVTVTFGASQTANTIRVTIIG